MKSAARSLLAHDAPAIKPADAARAQRTLEALSTADTPSKEQLRALLEQPAARALLAAAAGNAPYLAMLMQREAAFLPTLLFEAATDVRDQLLADCHNQIIAATDIVGVMEVARLAKRRIALLTALADLTTAWPLHEVTSTLSKLADTVIEASCCWLLKQAAAKGKIELRDPEHPTRGSGLIVLAMGKYGACELNYSSDIDIIVFFEPDGLTFNGDTSPSEFFVRLTRDLTRILEEPTGGGYVFRTDLRLRPDAGATAIAISAAAAEVYYETMGQNWERAAMIKARECAGDLEAGHRLLQMLSPFVWRRYLDFAAIEDIHSLKRQIHTHRGHSVIAVEGHDIKLGRGGIREIEFFVQIQQLIGGGKLPELRGRGTVPMLHALVDEGWIDVSARDELIQAYTFLRCLEHRLQMVDDQQTHRMPKTKDGVRDIALFMGYTDETAFREYFTKTLQTVEAHYASLFEREPALSEEAGSLVFTGPDPDPGTIKTLADMGFASPTSVIETVRKWHFGRIQATRAARSRELLTKLTPTLLRALATADEPDKALARFDTFLTGQPAGVQFFSLLYQNPALLDLLSAIMGSAPMLARYMSEHPNVLEAVIAADFHGPLADLHTRGEEVREALRFAYGFEQALDLARIYAREHLFQIGVQVLTGTAPAREAGPAYADLATALVQGLVPVAAQDIARAHGSLPGGEMAVVAMGKLGGREMAATSDLDLIVIYEFENDAAESDGDRPIDGVRYYTRVCQRLISALTAPTAEGPLYEVDMRLRPSGHAGPLATRLRSFITYHRESAWTWEKMALTRARVITGSPAMQQRVRSAIADALCTRHDPSPGFTGEAKRIAQDVSDMRERVFKELGSDDLWDIKHGRGGLVDLEFIAQALQLIHAPDNPDLLDSNTHNALEKLMQAKLIGQAMGTDLAAAADRYHNLTQILRIAVSGEFKPDTASSTLKDRLARAVDAPSFAIVERELRETQKMVNDAFDNLVLAYTR